MQNQVATTHQSRLSRLNSSFLEMLDRLLQILSDHLPANLSTVIISQMNNLKLLPSIFPETVMLELPQDQYHALSTINMYLGRNDGIKWPYFLSSAQQGLENRIL